MRPPSAAAKILNAAQNAEMRRRMRRHAGRAVAFRAGAVRFCFRIDAGGRWQAAMPQIAADAEIRLCGGKFQLGGDAALLRDLDEMRGAPRRLLEEIFGAEVAGFAADTAARLDIKNCPVNGGIAAAPAAVDEFNRQTAALAQKSRDLEARIARMEKRHD